MKDLIVILAVGAALYGALRVQSSDSRFTCSAEELLINNERALQCHGNMWKLELAMGHPVYHLKDAVVKLRNGTEETRTGMFVMIERGNQ